MVTARILFLTILSRTHTHTHIHKRRKPKKEDNARMTEQNEIEEENTNFNSRLLSFFPSFFLIRWEWRTGDVTHTVQLVSHNSRWVFLFHNLSKKCVALVRSYVCVRNTMLCGDGTRSERAKSIWQFWRCLSECENFCFCLQYRTCAQAHDTCPVVCVHVMCLCSFFVVIWMTDWLFIESNRFVFQFF